MALLDNLLNIDDTLNQILGGGAGTTGLLSPVTNLVENLTGMAGSDEGALANLLDLGLLTEEGVVELNLLGQELVVLPANGGIIDSDLLNGGVTDLTGNLTGIIELDGLLGEAGLLDLTGIIGEDGILDLDALLGDVLELLVVDSGLDPDDLLDPDGEVDPDSFDNQFIGTNGRDTFTVTQGSTYIDGRGDIDTVNFARSSEGMSFAVGANAVVFADDDELFYFQDAERIEFFEGTLLLDTDAGENAGMGYRLYQAAFDRTPDADGLEYWINELDAGVSLEAIADSFLYSPEFIRTFGTTETVSNAEFVELLYTHTLSRDSDSTGFDYWVERLENGQTNRGDLLAFFSESEENVAQVAPEIENGIWIA